MCVVFMCAFINAQTDDESAPDASDVDYNRVSADTDSDDTPSSAPSAVPSSAPSSVPSAVPSSAPSAVPSSMPSMSWHTDVSHTLPKSAFVKMGSTLATAVPVDLGWQQTNAIVIEDDGKNFPSSGTNSEFFSGNPYHTPYDSIPPPNRNPCSITDRNPTCEPYTTYDSLAPNIGVANGTAEVYVENPLTGLLPVHLNSFAGAAHAHCLSLSVEDPTYDHGFQLQASNFRVCDSLQLQALAAVITMPSDRWIMTLSSAHGDDYNVGRMTSRISRVLGWGVPGPYMDYVSGGNTGGDKSDQDYFLMQGFVLATDEQSPGLTLEEAPDGLVAYCCAGPEIPQNGKGASENRQPN